MATSTAKRTQRRKPREVRRAAAHRPASAFEAWSSGPAQVLTRHAERGVFRSFTALSQTANRAAFNMQWHKERTFEIIADGASKTVRMSVVLPNVPARSDMDRAYRLFLLDFQNGELPPHRSIDKRKAALKCVNRLGDISLVLSVLDGDYAYATEKLLAVAHESYLLFLQLGSYADYMVENLGANPDWGK
jgi:hypothetical protein